MKTSDIVENIINKLAFKLALLVRKISFPICDLSVRLVDRLA